MAENNQPVACPLDPTWLRRMLEILPPGLRGKLEPYEGCLDASNSVPAPSSSGQQNGRQRVVRPVVR